LESAKRVVLGLATGSAVQSVLLYGMEGSGKRKLARILTKAWLCRNPSPDSGACGECQACLAFDRDRSADILWLEPTGPSRIIHLAAISPAEEKDEYPLSAQHFLRTPPLSAKGKVVVIEDAERLNARAANSLLKTLEEPPSYGRFILLTVSVGSILPTILSRCLGVACEVPSDISGRESWALATAGGAPGRADELIDFQHVYRPIYDFALRLASRSREEALIAAEEFAGLADALQAARKTSSRAADAEALQVLAMAYGLASDNKPDSLLAIVEAHRRVLGNGNAGATFDALFATVLG
jgi:DNA polymerase III delta prime subunit